MGRPINLPRYLSRAPEGVLAPHLVSFAKDMLDRGYRSETVYMRTMASIAFSRWLTRRKISVREVRWEHCEQFLQRQTKRIHIVKYYSVALRQLLRFMRQQRVIPLETPPRRPIDPVERCQKGFERYLRDVRGLADVTIIDSIRYVRPFLTERFQGTPFRLSELCARDIVAYVDRTVVGWHSTHAQHLAQALRSFLRYARYCGALHQDLQGAVPSIASWRLSSIPKLIPPAHIRCLLERCDRSTPKGRRDYAILLLLVRLGLRSGEIARLELDDIDWRAGCLRVRGKGTPGQLPLPVDVGRAIAAYLRNGRPSCPSRRLFLRVEAPIVGFRHSSAIGSMIRRLIRRTQLDFPTRGTHQFRHALASQMLRGGACLSEIGEVLRHRTVNVTQIYAKVDLDRLRTLALRWPGGVS
jgi:integrase/recombinase XerD